MYKISFLRPIVIVGLITVLFASCDKDFDELGTDIVGDNHFDFKYDYKAVTAYNQDLGPIASNGLAINPLGTYVNPAFGTTKADFVTQITMASVAPAFNNVDPTKFEDLPVIDSVILEVPYFGRIIKANDDGTKTYKLDSIYGAVDSKFKLNIYRSNYYLRDLDPDQSLEETQLFYTDNNVIGGNIDFASGILNNSDNVNENSQFSFSPKEHKTSKLDSDGNETNPRSAPSMRLHLSKQFFYDKIVSTPASNLSSNSVFKNYFRGLYFQTENTGNEESMAMLNFAAGKITMYYKEDLITPDNPATTTVDEYNLQRLSKTFIFNLNGNSVSLLNNSNMNPGYTSAINPSNNTDPNGTERLYVKGGQGSMAVVEIFGKTDVKGLAPNPNYNSNLPISATNTKYLINPNYNPSLSISDTNPKYVYTTGSNGVSDEIDEIRANEWLINEANLVFNIDTDKMENIKTIEPNRLYLYDLNNSKALVDYTYDYTSSISYPKFNKAVFGGILQDDNGKIVKQKDENGLYTSSKGTKYKIRITNHVRNLIKNDSTNVKLGLVVTENINSTAFSKRKTPITNNVSIKSAPTGSVVNQLGTVLYGTNVPTTDPNYGKRLRLEIIYTKPKN